jgi:cell division septation protein DedD
MENISSYTVGISTESLRHAFEAGETPTALYEPFQSLLPVLTRSVAQRPIAVYLCSSDGEAEIRDLFAYALATSLAKHVPSTLLVDCSFLEVGMHGVVPQGDALGFLDLLLYGSSLAVITQESRGGVHVIGAGSFPVTKKMPFVLDAFQEAARRLLAHSRCVIFCGPLQDDEGNLHPIMGATDLPLLVRSVDAVKIGAVDRIEEEIASRCNVPLLSVRITPFGDAAPAPEPALEEEVPREPIETAVEPEGWTEFRAQAPVEPEKPKPREAPEAAKPKEDRLSPRRTATVPHAPEREAAQAAEEKRYVSLVPRIVTALIAVAVVAFVVWWFNQERGNGAGEERPAVGTVGQTAAVPDTNAEVSGIPASTETTMVAAAPENEPATRPVEQPDTLGAQVSVPPPSESPPSGPRIDPQNIIVAEDLEKTWTGYYFIHISSFRESSLARTEIASLQKRGFPVFIMYVNLEAKGNWYRVYAGPFGTREEAREMKKLLDGTPGVRFTRITQVAGRG